MAIVDQRFKQPLQLVKKDGAPRHVGVEIEMSGLDLDTIVRDVLACFGGHIDKISEYEYSVKQTGLGDFKVELDFEYVQKLARERISQNPTVLEQLEAIATDALVALAMNVVPCELVSPPIAFDQLPDLQRVVDRLRTSGAQGTRQSMIFAFGVHLNPEPPDLTATTMLNYLRAFICLCDWLVDKAEVTLSRKFSPYIKPFPNDYIEKILPVDYLPDLPQLIDDYLYFNPTRNRMLDMLPLFAHLNEAQVVNVIGKQKLRKRPTFHYRLPNSEIDRADWGLWCCWNDWLQVESLANDPQRLLEVCAAYLYNHNSFSIEMIVPWKYRVEAWLIDL